MDNVVRCLTEDFQVSDVIQVKGPSVPRELWDKWWRVAGTTDCDSVALDGPYVDKECKTRYHGNPPILR